MSSAWDGLENTPLVTELPHYAFGKNPEDPYYTRREVAEHCVEQFYKVCKAKKIGLQDYIFIEPSAGEGCFYDCLPTDRTIAMDINPRRKEVQQSDYLSWYPMNTEGKYVVIGNPPFGHRGAVALAFVNRSFLFADLVAFILPMSFFSNGKGVNMKRVINSTLIHNEYLDKDAFYEPGTGTPVSVNTVFQIWRKGKHKSAFVDYDVSDFVEIYTCCSAPSRYCGLGRGRNYDCFVASTFYGNDIRIVPTFEEVKYGSGYGMIIKKRRKTIMKILAKTDWIKYSTKATNSCRHIRMYHIRKALGDQGIGRTT